MASATEILRQFCPTLDSEIVDYINGERAVAYNNVWDPKDTQSLTKHTPPLSFPLSLLFVPYTLLLLLLLCNLHWDGE